MIVVGIDPGKSGYVAGINKETGSIVLIEPTPTIKVGKGSRREYDVQGMVRIIRGFACVSTMFYIEKQQAMPGQGTASMFSIGMGYGIWVGIVAGLEYPHKIVHPRTWKAVMVRDIPGDDIKGRSILACQRLLPKVDLRISERARKPSHDKAEALLLALYGIRDLEGETK